MSPVHFDQARRKGGVGGVKQHPAPRRLRALQSLKNIKYTRMHHFEKSDNFLPIGAPRECFPGPHCGSRWAWFWSVDH